MSNLFLPGFGPPAEPESSKPSIPDAAERERALDVRHSWIVEAPAGSGKTGLLIQRFLKLLADDSVTAPGQVLAITFTEKATAEMRERVQAQLEAAAHDDSPTNDFDRDTRSLAEAVLRNDQLHGWNLLDNPRQLNIRTIDAVCAEIARSLPVLSGGGRQSPIPDSSTLYQAAARRTLLEFGGHDAALNHALRTVLLHRDGNLAECEALLAEMLQWRDQWGELVPLTQEELDDAHLDEVVRPRLERAIEQAVCDGLSSLAQSIPSHILHDLASLAAELGHNPGVRGNPSPIAVCAGVHSPPGEAAEDLARWRALIHLLTTADGRWRKERGITGHHLKLEYDRKLLHHIRLVAILDQISHRDDILAAFDRIKTLPPAKYPEEQWRVAKALFRLLRHALAELKLIFAERGECDFAELGLLARQALRREGAAEGLSNALGMSLQHLLVDEMQDTSTSQYELIQLLTQGWDGQSQTVFLVGDPKQSIYLFRQARVERFIRTMQTLQLGDLRLGCLRLTANFRSQRNLVEQFNQDFALLFAPPDGRPQANDVPYVAASALRPPTASRAVVWHTSILHAGDTKEQSADAAKQQALQNAQAIRNIALEWRARPLPANRAEPWKIAVLVSNRKHLQEIVSAFKQDDGNGPVPFRAIDIERLGERPEVLDLFALTRALLHPADRVAWLAVLHTSWCGLSLADLHALTGADNAALAQRCVEDLIVERGHLLSDDGCERLKGPWLTLQAATQQRGRLSTSQWVERTWRSLGGDAPLDATASSNATRYLQLLDEVETQSGRIDLKQLQNGLDKLYAKPVPSHNAVDLMTIHGAKGLEWDVVIVPALDRPAPPISSRLLAWDEIETTCGQPDDQATIVLAPIPGKGQDSHELNLWLKELTRTREAAERRRLFYVACTRAREELHLFASPSLKANGEVYLKPGSLLGAAWPVASHRFDEAMQQQPANIVVMPTRVDEADQDYEFDIAASVEPQLPVIIQRLPLSFDPRARFASASKLPCGDAATSQPAHFTRPEGSFAARALGSAIHNFLELFSNRLATGATIATLLGELPALRPRIQALLRSGGLPPAAVDRLTANVHAALENTLKDEHGQWLLSKQHDAASEYALTSWQLVRTTVRIDRIFRAGEEPLAGGGRCLWIVDYKTATHGREGLEAFLAEEQRKYAPQMDAYARVLSAREPSTELRIALYYPMLSRLLWWKPEA